MSSQCIDCGTDMQPIEVNGLSVTPPRCDNCAADLRQKEALPDQRELHRNLSNVLDEANLPLVFRQGEVEAPDHPVVAEFVKRDYPNEQNGLYLYGSSGRSKTKTACEALKWYTKRQLQNGARCQPYFLTSLSWVSDQLGGGDRHSLERIRTADFLVIDDLGKTGSHDAVIEKLHLLINQRCNTGLPTVFTSNVPPGDPNNASHREDDTVYLMDVPSYMSTTINRIRWMTGEGDYIVPMEGHQ